MRLLYALIAHDAEMNSQGNLDIMATYRRITATNAPVRMAKVCLVAAWEVEPFDRGRDILLEVRLVDPDGRQIDEHHETVLLEEDVPLRLSWYRMTHFDGTVFPSFGPYAFLVRVDGTEVARVDLWVERIDAATEPA